MKRVYPILLVSIAVIFVGIISWIYIKLSNVPEIPIGWYCAGSNVIDDKALGGFGPCDNLPKKYTNGFPAPDGQVSLLAFPDEIVEREGHKLISLRLVNRSNQVVGFVACNSQLYIVQESRHFGQWRPLEGFPQSWCGNSFHRVFLEPNEYWDFYGRRQKDEILRFRLERGGGIGVGGQGESLFSNEYQE
jgi:hypothetical protein